MEETAILTPGDHKQVNFCAPEETISIKMVSEPLCSRERWSTTQDTDKENHPGHRTEDPDRKSLVSG